MPNLIDCNPNLNNLPSPIRAPVIPPVIPVAPAIPPVAPPAPLPFYTQLKQRALAQLPSWSVPPLFGFLYSNALTMMFYLGKPILSLGINQNVYNPLCLNISAAATLATLTSIDLVEQKPNNFSKGLKFVAKQLTTLGLFHLFYYVIEPHAFNQLSTPILFSAQIIAPTIIYLFPY